MKKFICVFISILMIFGAFAVCSAYAEDNGAAFTLNGTEYKAEIGDEITYTMDVQCTQLVEAAQFIIYFPDNLLRIKSGELIGVTDHFCNIDVKGEVNCNFSSPNNFNFKTQKQLLVVKFDVIANGAGEFTKFVKGFYNPDDIKITEGIDLYEALEVVKPPTEPETTEATSSTASESTEATFTTAPTEAESTTDSTESTASTESESERVESLKRSLMNEVADASMGIVEGVECRGDKYLYYDEFEAAYKAANQLLNDESATVVQLEQALNNIKETRKKLVRIKPTTEPTTAAQTEAQTTTAPQQETTDPAEQVDTTAPATDATESSTALAPETTAPVTGATDYSEPATEESEDVAEPESKLKASYAPLKAKAEKVSKKAIKLRWSKVKKAKKYAVYGAKADGKYKLLKKVKSTAFTVKKLKKGRTYKFIIVAKTSNGASVTKSAGVYAVTKGSKYSNPVKVKLSKKKLSLKVKKSKRIKASVVMPAGKKLKEYKKIRFESSNKKIVKVNKEGKITALKKGRAVVYAYAQNGVMNKVKVVVK